MREYNPSQHDYLPALAGSLAACLRWSRKDLDDLLERQLLWLAGDPWSNRQRSAELQLAAQEPTGNA